MHGQTRSNNGTSTTRSGRLAANAANAAAPATAAMATAARADFPPLHAIEERVDRLIAVDRPRYRRLWNYCRNPMRAVGAGATGGDQDRPYRQAQEWGLPARITGARPGGDVLGGGGGGGGIADVGTRKEVVIENDIGWRIETMVDYLFGRPLVIESAAPDPDRRALISELLRQVLAVNGGILLLQEMALLGSVYGFVDVLVKLDADAAARAATANAHEAAATAPGAGDLGEPPAAQNKRGAGAAATPGALAPTAGTAPTILPDGVLPSNDGRAAGNGGAAAPLAGPAPRPGQAAPGGDRDDELSGDTRAAGDQTPRAAAAPAPLTVPVARLARTVRLEVVEPARALPFLSDRDYRRIDAYAQVIDAPPPGGAFRGGGDDDAAPPRRTWVDLLRRFASPRRLVDGSAPDPKYAVEVITPARWRRYENGKVVAEGANSLGRVPVVHVQNTSVPFAYAGGSDVEPLIPLQDELNTRLSDRANRITLQSFKMYLGKNIENFTEMPVAPGRMWVSDERDADVIEFGGDASCPSEEAHIGETREALDKTSGVTPIAAGAIKGRIGHLTSAAALRVTLQALLAKTEKKRTTYGTAIEQACELALAWLDRAGLFPTAPDERRVELNWPSPIPENESEKLREAEAKLRLGVPRDVVLRELGY